MGTLKVSVFAGAMSRLDQDSDKGERPPQLAFCPFSRVSSVQIGSLLDPNFGR
jgi:hypothetical protein